MNIISGGARFGGEKGQFACAYDMSLCSARDPDRPPSLAVSSINTQLSPVSIFAISTLFNIYLSAFIIRSNS